MLRQLADEVSGGTRRALCTAVRMLEGFEKKFKTKRDVAPKRALRYKSATSSRKQFEYKAISFVRA